jgi:hypothetical protein
VTARSTAGFKGAFFPGPSTFWGVDTGPISNEFDAAREQELMAKAVATKAAA